MNKGYQSFIEHTGSRLSKNSFPTNTCFSTYRFSSESGTGYTSIYELNAFASICIAEHSYHRDFEYAIISDEAISIHQYDSIDSDHSYLRGDVYSGLQYIGHTSDNEMCRYVIKKNVPAKVITVQLAPEYYETYLKKEVGIRNIDLKTELQVFPHGFSIPEISSIFNQIRSFKGNESSAKLFFRSKIDELTANLIQKADELRRLSANVSATDRYAISEVMTTLNQSLSKRLPLKILAADACMSASKFKYVFKAVAGQTLSEYVTQKRMEYACELLTNSSLYIAEIARLVGYKNPGSFSAQFKKSMGLLPLAYRLNKISA